MTDPDANLYGLLDALDRYLKDARWTEGRTLTPLEVEMFVAGLRVQYAPQWVERGTPGRPFDPVPSAA